MDVLYVWMASMDSMSVFPSVLSCAVFVMFHLSRSIFYVECSPSTVDEQRRKATQLWMCC